jgi:UDP-N-acetylmuramate--alanine ligase
VQTHFCVTRPGRDTGLSITLNLPGRHNVLNALAAIAVATELGVPDEVIQEVLAGFEGIGRRFQMGGEIETPAGRVLLIDDYAHHPREIAPTLAAVRAGWPERRLVVAFQPHRYTRTHDLFDDFVQVLSGVDALILCEVYPAGEPPLSGADGRALCRGIRARGHADPVFVEHIADLPAVLQDILQDGDVLVTMGAGDIGAVSAGLVDALQVREESE